ncbi:MAG: CopG family transcriptional regulator [Thermoleophilaceae bacterium]
MVQLSEELVRLLDREAARRGMSRSALIRGMLEEGLADEREAAVGRQIVEGYRRVPPATPDEWGDLAAMVDGAARDLLHRLDAEERAAGHSPW